MPGATTWNAEVACSASHWKRQPSWAATRGALWGPDLVVLDDAMNALARIDPRKVQVVEMRFFGGLNVEETAEVLKVSPVTVKRDWRAAKAWLYRELTGGTTDGP